jgi:hypothetical protein
MTRVVVDAELLNRLNNLTEPLELCDESGKILARVNPAIDWSQYEFLTPDISDEERERRLSTDRRYTTKEAIEYLRKHERS